MRLKELTLSAILIFSTSNFCYLQESGEKGLNNTKLVDENQAEIDITLYNPNSQLQPGILVGYLNDSLVLADSTFDGQEIYTINFEPVGIETRKVVDQFSVGPNPVDGQGMIFLDQLTGQLNLFDASYGRKLDGADVTNDRDLAANVEGPLILQYINKDGVGTQQILNLGKSVHLNITDGHTTNQQPTRLKAIAAGENFILEYTDPSGDVEKLIKAFSLERGEYYTISEVLEWAVPEGKKAVYLKGDFSSNATLNIPGQEVIGLGSDGKLGKTIFVDQALDSLDIYANAPYANAEMFRKIVQDTIFLNTLLQREFEIDTKGPREALLSVYGPNDELLVTVDAGDDFRVERRTNELALRVEAAGTNIEENYVKQIVAQVGKTVLDVNDIRWQHILNATGEELAAYEVQVEDSVYRGVTTANGSFSLTHLSNEQSGLQMIKLQTKDNYVSETDTIITSKGITEKDFGQLLAQYSIIEKSGGERVTKLLGELYLEQKMYVGDAVFSFTDTRDSINTLLEVDNSDYLLFEKNLVLKPGETIENPNLQTSGQTYSHLFGFKLQSNKPYIQIKDSTEFLLKTSAGEMLLYSQLGTIGGFLQTNRPTEKATLTARHIPGHQPLKEYSFTLGTDFFKDTLNLELLNLYIAATAEAVNGDGYPIEGVTVKPGIYIEGTTGTDGKVRFDSIPAYLDAYGVPQDQFINVLFEKEGLHPIIVPDTITYGNSYFFYGVMDTPMGSYHHEVTLNFICNTFDFPGGVHVPIITDEQNTFMSPYQGRIHMSWYSVNAKSPLIIGDIEAPGFDLIPGIDTSVTRSLELYFVADPISYNDISLSVVVHDQDNNRIPNALVENDFGSELTNENGEAIFIVPQQVTSENEKTDFELVNSVIDTEENEVDFNSPPSSLNIIDEESETISIQVLVDKTSDQGGDTPPISNLSTIYAYGNNCQPSDAVINVWKHGNIVMQGTISNGKYVSSVLEVDKDDLPYVADSLTGSYDNYISIKFSNPTFNAAEQFEINLTPLSNDPDTYKHVISGNIRSNLVEKTVVAGQHAYYVLAGDTTWIFVDGSGNFSHTYYSESQTHTNIPIGVMAPGFLRAEVNRNVESNVSVSLEANAIDYIQDLHIRTVDDQMNPVSGITISTNGKTVVSGNDGWAVITDMELLTSVNNVFFSYKQTITASIGDYHQSQGYDVQQGTKEVYIVIDPETPVLFGHYVRFELENNLGKGMRDGGFALLNIPGKGIIQTAFINGYADVSWQDENKEINIVASIKELPGYEDSTPKTYAVDESEVFQVMVEGTIYYSTIFVNVGDQHGAAVEGALVINSGESDYTNAEGIAELSIPRLTGPDNIDLLNSNTTSSVSMGISGLEFSTISSALIIDEEIENQFLEIEVAKDVKTYEFRTRAMSITGNNYISNTPNVFLIETSQGTFSGASNSQGHVTVQFEAFAEESVSIKVGASSYDLDYFGINGIGSTRNNGPLIYKAEDLNRSFSRSIIAKQYIVDNPDFQSSTSRAGAYNGALLQRWIWTLERSTGTYVGDDFVNLYTQVLTALPGVLSTPLTGTLVNVTEGITVSENIPPVFNGYWVFYRYNGYGYRNGSFAERGEAYTEGLNYSGTLEEGINLILGDDANGSTGKLRDWNNLNDIGQASLIDIMLLQKW